MKYYGTITRVDFDIILLQGRGMDRRMSREEAAEDLEDRGAVTVTGIPAASAVRSMGYGDYHSLYVREDRA